MQQKPKRTPARQRAEEALDQVARSSSQPTRNALAFLLRGSHEPELNQDQPQTISSPNPEDHSKSKPGHSNQSVAPDKDYNKRANSLDRVALPAGMFSGASKRLYDSLYVRTRGAVKPTRTVQATRRELMQWSGIKDIKTINTHLKRLHACGLLTYMKYNGDHEGSIYEVFLLEENNPDQTQTRPRPDPDQKLVPVPDQKLVWVGSGNRLENKDTYGFPKTFFKTNTNDDERFTLFTEIFGKIERELTGRNALDSPAERERWKELAEVLIAELRDAAAHTTITSVPAFLAAHLKRRFAQKTSAQKSGAKPTAAALEQRGEKASPPALERRLTNVEINEQTRLIMELLEGGYTMDQAETQFAGSFHAEDWTAIRDALEGK